MFKYTSTLNILQLFFYGEKFASNARFSSKTTINEKIYIFMIKKVYYHIIILEYIFQLLAGFYLY